MKKILLFFILSLFCIKQGVMGQASATACPDTSGESSFATPASTTACSGEAVDLPAYTPGTLPNSEFLVTNQDTIVGIVAATATDFDPANFGFVTGDEVCVTAVAYDVTTVQAILDAIDPTDSAGTCCGVLEAAIDPMMESPEVLCELLCDTAGICSGADVVGFQQVIDLFAAFGADPIVDSLFTVINTLNQTVEDQAAVLPFVCPGLLENFPVCVSTSNEICYTIEECIDCATASGGSFAAPDPTPVCTDAAATIPAFTTGDLTTTEFLVTDDQNNILGILPVGTTDFIPEDYGFADGESACITAINYEITVVQGIIDAIDPATSAGTCCGVLEAAFDPTMESPEVLCELLCDTAGICSSADVVGFQQVIDLFAAFGAEPNVDSLFSSIDTLNQTVEDQAALLPLVCPGLVENFPVCVVASNRVCYAVQSCAMGCTDVTACNYDDTAVVDDGSCTFVNGGTISTVDATTICAGDGIADPINVTTTGTGANYVYIITDGTGTTILAGPTTDTTFDLDGAGVGACLIWGIAHDSINVPTDQVADITGCFSLSNSITVVREQAGCTDVAACNYDAAAQCDDSSCILPDGCTDMNACNFNAAATCDDGSCSNADPMTGNTDICAGDTEVWNPVTCMYDIDETQVLGCTDVNATNYNMAANCDDGSCMFTMGCTDMGACNYDVMATIDDGSCEFTSCAGCTDMAACNYDATATIDDASCSNADPGTGNTDICAGDTEVWNPVTCMYDIDETQVLGCTDVNATNYNMAANCDDGSCMFTMGCTDITACNYDATATIDDGSCEFTSCAGCTDMAACNYDATATIDDASCSNADPMTGNTDICAGDTEVWNAVTCMYDIDETQVLGCTDPTAINYNMAANCDDGTCMFAMGCTDMGACNYDVMATIDDGSCEFTSCAGCTSTTACNYDATATIDDGSCNNDDPGTGNTDICAGNTEVWNTVTCTYDVDMVQVNGCTDATAINYDPLANCDDGSCSFSVDCATTALPDKDLGRDGALYGEPDFTLNGNEVYTWFDENGTKVAEFTGTPYYSPTSTGEYLLIVTDPDSDDCTQTFGPRLINELNGCCELESDN